MAAEQLDSFRVGGANMDEEVRNPRLLRVVCVAVLDGSNLGRGVAPVAEVPVPLNRLESRGARVADGGGQRERRRRVGHQRDLDRK